MALALRVAKGAEEVDAGPRAVPVMPLAALAPGLATREAPDIAGAMRARLGKIADGSLGERKKTNKLSFNLQGGPARRQAAVTIGRLPAMRRWATSEHAQEEVRGVWLEGFRAEGLPSEASTVRL